MKSAILPIENYRARASRPRCAASVLRVLWLFVRMPLLVVLLALEPAASFLLTAVGILGIAAALVIRLSGALSQFPFWGMLGFSVGVLLLLTAYHSLIGLLSY